MEITKGRVTVAGKQLKVSATEENYLSLDDIIGEVIIEDHREKFEQKDKEAREKVREMYVKTGETLTVNEVNTYFDAGVKVKVGNKVFYPKFRVWFTGQYSYSWFLEPLNEDAEIVENMILIDNEGNEYQLVY